MGNEQKSEVQKQNVGNAGEYYIAPRLSALNFVATITLGRTERYDILALGPKGKLVKLSVKTRQNRDATAFPLSVKDENGAAGGFYYAFVKLNEFEAEPDSWVIHSKRVSTLIRGAHEKYLSAPGRNGNNHKDIPMRTLPIEVTRGQARYYPEDWEEELKIYYKSLGLDQLV